MDIDSPNIMDGNPPLLDGSKSTFVHHGRIETHKGEADQLPKKSSSIESDAINYLVYRYLVESGMCGLLSLLT